MVSTANASYYSKILSILDHSATVNEFYVFLWDKKNMSTKGYTCNENVQKLYKKILINKLSLK